MAAEITQIKVQGTPYEIKSKRNSSFNTVTSLSGLPVDKNNIVANISSASNTITFASGCNVGSTIYINVHPTVSGSVNLKGTGCISSHWGKVNFLANQSFVIKAICYATDRFFLQAPRTEYVDIAFKFINGGSGGNLDGVTLSAQGNDVSVSGLTVRARRGAKFKYTGTKSGWTMAGGADVLYTDTDNSKEVTVAMSLVQGGYALFKGIVPYDAGLTVNGSNCGTTGNPVGTRKYSGITAHMALPWRLSRKGFIDASGSFNTGTIGAGANVEYSLNPLTRKTGSVKFTAGVPGGQNASTIASNVTLTASYAEALGSVLPAASHVKTTTIASGVKPVAYTSGPIQWNTIGGVPAGTIITWKTVINGSENTNTYAVDDFPSSGVVEVPVVISVGGCGLSINTEPGDARVYFDGALDADKYTAVQFGGSVSYEVKHDLYLKKSGTRSDIRGNVSERVVLVKKQGTVALNGLDPNSSVSVTDTASKKYTVQKVNLTNPSRTVFKVLDVLAGTTLNYTITCNCKNTISSSRTIENFTSKSGRAIDDIVDMADLADYNISLSQTHKQATFTISPVTDATTGGAVPNPQISIDGTAVSQKTVPCGTEVKWVVSAEGYRTKSGSHAMGDTNIKLPVVLERDYYVITFSPVDDLGGSVPGATLYINGQAQSGLTYNAQRGVSFNWEVRAVGYKTAAGSKSNVAAAETIRPMLAKYIKYTFNINRLADDGSAVGPHGCKNITIVYHRPDGNIDSSRPAETISGAYGTTFTIARNDYAHWEASQPGFSVSTGDMGKFGNASHTTDFVVTETLIWNGSSWTYNFDIKVQSQYVSRTCPADSIFDYTITIGGKKYTNNCIIKVTPGMVSNPQVDWVVDAPNYKKVSGAADTTFAQLSKNISAQCEFDIPIKKLSDVVAGDVLINNGAIIGAIHVGDINLNNNKVCGIVTSNIIGGPDAGTTGCKAITIMQWDEVYTQVDYKLPKYKWLNMQYINANPGQWPMASTTLEDWFVLDTSSSEANDKQIYDILSVDNAFENMIQFSTSEYVAHGVNIGSIVQPWIAEDASEYLNNITSQVCPAPYLAPAFYTDYESQSTIFNDISCVRDPAYSDSSIAPGVLYPDWVKSNIRFFGAPSGVDLKYVNKNLNSIASTWNELRTRIVGGVDTSNLSFKNILNNEVALSFIPYVAGSFVPGSYLPAAGVFVKNPYTNSTPRICGNNESFSRLGFIHLIY